MATNPEFIGVKKILLDGLATHWVAALPGTVCPRCKGTDLQRSMRFLMRGPFSGSIRCMSCDYRNSVMAHLAQACFSVEPLPEGALTVIYTKDSDKK